MSAEQRVFIDTNVLAYVMSSDDRKADIAEALLRDATLDRIISVQVVNELVHTARKKANLDWEEIRFLVDTLREACRVVCVTPEDQDEAFEVAERYRFAWYDSLVVASALRTQALVLLTEDFQHGQRIGALTVSNPFEN